MSKSNVKWVFLVLIVGYFVLLFFPEPETNFIAYFITATLFVLFVIILLLKPQRKK